MACTMERDYYHELKDYPRPSYPFPDLINSEIDNLAQEYDSWIDDDCSFESESARERHKRHRLADIAARAFPQMSLPELRPVARFTAFLAILDDCLDRAVKADFEEVVERVTSLLTEENAEPEAGFYHQIYMMRMDFATRGIPLHCYRPFVDSILSLLVAYSDEKRYNVSGRAPAQAVYQDIRRQTSGGVCYAKYLCLHEKYQRFPTTILTHPTILRLQDICGSLIGYHNDLISLPKELARGGDIINIVISLQHEFGMSLQEAYFKALEIHDAQLEEFIYLKANLPKFGSRWQELVESYVADLGIMLQGVYAWHINETGRYLPGAYVEPEHGPASVL